MTSHQQIPGPSRLWPVEAKELQRYLEENIDYTLDAENMRGLERFFEESEALKLIGPAHRISMADSATAVRFP